MSLKNYLNLNLLEAGCDEAGRGCLAGPVFAAAVILPKNLRLKHLTDSKELTHQQRLELRAIIQEKAICWAVAHADNYEIDKINILNASFLAMHRAIEKLTTKPEFLLIDGNRFKPYKNIPFQCIIKGDGKYKPIAAASILAKTYRDEFMDNLHEQHPIYDWINNKGYPTDSHRKAIVQYGVTNHHRQSFRLYPLPEQQVLF